jgi:tetratricopeptide (TPR) repeat protein
MFDETPDQVEESNALKLACYLNISQCLLKVQSYDKAIENCKYALAIDPENAKAFFRRGSAYHAKKEYELAHPDLLKASDLLPLDKVVKSLFVKNQQQITLAKEREKKMYSAMFS